MNCTYEYKDKSGLSESDLIKMLLKEDVEDSEIMKFFSLNSPALNLGKSKKDLGNGFEPSRDFLYRLRKVGDKIITVDDVNDTTGDLLLPRYDSLNRIEAEKQEYLKNHPNALIPEDVVKDIVEKINQDEAKMKIHVDLRQLLYHCFNSKSKDEIRNRIVSFVTDYICPYNIDSNNKITLKKAGDKNFNPEHLNIMFGDEKTRNIFIKQNLETIKNNINSVVDALYEPIVKIVDDLRNTYIDGGFKVGKYYENTEDGYYSRISFIGVKSDGSVDVIEFVGGSRDYENWDSAKKLLTDYRLGLDRTILTSNGVPFEKISLSIIPINFNYGAFLYQAPGSTANISSFSIGPIQVRSASNVSKSGLGMNGLITQNLKQFEHIKPSIQTNPKNLDEIAQNLYMLTRGGWTPNLEVNVKSLEEYIEYIKSRPKEKGKYVIWKSVGTNVKKVLCKDDAELEKEAKIYFKELENNKFALVKDIITTFNLKTVTSSYEKPTDISDLFGIYKDPAIKQYVQRQFGAYLNGDWDALELPELIANNIVALRNKRTGVIDTFVLTADIIDRVYNLQNRSLEGKGNTILGAYMMNDEAYRRNNIMPIADTGNLEIVKVLEVYNTIPDLFRQHKLGNITCMSVRTGNSRKCDENLKREFNRLVNLAKLPNNYESGKIKQTSIIQRLQYEVNCIFYQMDNTRLRSKITDSFAKLTQLTDEEIDKQDKIKYLEQMIKDVEEAYNLSATSITEKSDFSRPEIYLLGLLSEVYAYYKGLAWINEAELANYGFSFSDILGTVIDLVASNRSKVDKNGRMIVGGLQGAQLSGSANSPSANIKSITKYIDSQIKKVRNEMMGECAKVQNYTIDFYNKSGRGKAFRFFIGDNYDLYQNLFEKDENGKIVSDFRVKNPFDLSNDLVDFQRDYLKNILWQLHKFKIKGLKESDLRKSFDEVKNIKEVEQYIADGYFFKIPLKRASDLSAWHNMSLNDMSAYGNYKMQELQHNFDILDLDSSRKEYYNKKKENYQKYPDMYGISDLDRQRFLESHDIFYWETNLDLLAMDVAFSATKRTIFTQTLDTLRYTLWGWKKLSFQTGMDLDKILNFLSDQIKITIFNESILDDEFSDLAKVNGVLRKINSVIKIGLRPAQWVKEMTVGAFRNWNIATVNALKGTEYDFTLEDMKNAEAFMIGYVFDKFGQLVKSDNDDIASFSLLNQFNNQYGIANMDINSIVLKMKTDRYGMAAGLSKWTYWFSTNPDLYNRMKMFVAQMYHDGCLEAHSIKDGRLVYDMSKDKRFSEYYAHRNEKGYTSKEFQKQKALYKIMMQEFVNEGTRNSNGDLVKMGDDLPFAYTTRQRNSLKELSDTMYGCYDHEAKMQLEHKLAGLLWFQFRTYWSGAVRRWLSPTSTQTSKGHYEQGKEEDGRLRYIKYIKNADGSVEIMIVHEDDEEFDEFCEPEMFWQGDIMEGVLTSIVKTLRDCGYFLTNSAGITEHKLEFSRERLSNCLIGIHDLFIGYLLCLIFDLMFFGEPAKEHFEDDGNISGEDFVLLKVRNIIKNASSEFGIDQVLPFNSWTPTQFQSMVKGTRDFMNLMRSEDPDLAKVIERNILAVGDITSTKVR